MCPARSYNCWTAVTPSRAYGAQTFYWRVKFGDVFSDASSFTVKIPDRVKPKVRALSGSALRGKRARFAVRAADDRGEVRYRATLLWRGGYTVLARSFPFVRSAWAKPLRFCSAQPAPMQLRPGRYVFCVKAWDRAGNHARNCAPLPHSPIRVSSALGRSRPVAVTQDARERVKSLAELERAVGRLAPRARAVGPDRVASSWPAAGARVDCLCDDQHATCSAGRQRKLVLGGEYEGGAASRLEPWHSNAVVSRSPPRPARGQLCAIAVLEPAGARAPALRLRDAVRGRVGLPEHVLAPLIWGRGLRMTSTTGSAHPAPSPRTTRREP